MSYQIKVRILSLLLAMITVLVCFAACSDNKEPQQQRGEFVPPAFDSAAIQGTPDISDPRAVGYSQLDAKAYKVSICGLVKLNENKADVYFTNPDSNDVWLKLRILNKEGEIIAETGLVRPGEYLQTITFKTVPQKGDKIVIRVMSYEPDTYYSKGEASLNTVVS